MTPKVPAAAYPEPEDEEPEELPAPLVVMFWLPFPHPIAMEKKSKVEKATTLPQEEDG